MIFNFIIAVFGIGIISIYHSDNKNTYSHARHPATVEPKKALELLYELTKPRLNRDQIKNITQQADLHGFFRAFPALYWKLAKEHIGAIKPLASIKSIIFGDVHVENFGTLICNQNIKASIDDFDDLAIGSVSFDMIRLIISIDLAKIDIDEVEILNHYKAGLKGEQLNNDMIQAIIDRANQNPHRPDGPISNHPPYQYVKIRNDAKRVDKLNYLPFTEIQRSLNHEFQLNLGQIHDAYERTKKDGGSAGLIRHHYLVQAQNDELFDIQYKPLLPSNSLYFYTNKVNKKTYKNRLKQFKRLLSQTGIDQCEVGSTVISGRDYIISKSLKAHQKISPLKYLVPDHQREIVRFQAQLLGNLHRQKMTTLKQSKYLTLLNQHEAEIILIKNLIQQEIKKIYAAIREK
jgi:hypothetical protein